MLERWERRTLLEVIRFEAGFEVVVLAHDDDASAADFETKCLFLPMYVKNKLSKIDE